jgi:hypothetical protein
MFPPQDATDEEVFRLLEGDRAARQKMEDVDILSETIGLRAAVFKVEGMNQQQQDSYDANVASILKQMHSDMGTESTNQ